MIRRKEANKLNNFKSKFLIDVIASFLCVNLRFFDAYTCITLMHKFEEFFSTKVKISIFEKNVEIGFQFYHRLKV